MQPECPAKLLKESSSYESGTKNPLSKSLQTCPYSPTITNYLPSYSISNSNKIHPSHHPNSRSVLKNTSLLASSGLVADLV
jgi:hypothetical protein